MPSPKSCNGWSLIGGGDVAGLDGVAARCLRHHPGATQQPAHRVKAAGAFADGGQGLECRLARLAPKYAGGDVLNVGCGLRREVALEADAPVHLLVAGQSYSAGHSGGRRSAQGRTCSKARAAWSTVSSAKRLPTICIPTGSPALVKPQGTEAAGFPLKLKG